MVEETSQSPRIQQIAWLVWIGLAIAMSVAVLPITSALYEFSISMPATFPLAVELRTMMPSD